MALGGWTAEAGDAVRLMPPLVMPEPFIDIDSLIFLGFGAGSTEGDDLLRSR